MSGLLNLACHRDAAVRALALSVVTEFQCVAATNTTAAVTTAAAVDVSPEGNRPEHGVGGGADGRSGGVDGAVGGEASLHRHELEIMEAFVRAAGDEFHECAAVRVEALRFLCRCGFVRAVVGKKVWG